MNELKRGQRWVAVIVGLCLSILLVSQWNLSYSIPLYFILFQSILQQSILFQSSLFCYSLFYFSLVYSIRFQSIPLESILLQSTLIQSILFQSILFYSTIVQTISFLCNLLYSIMISQNLTSFNLLYVNKSRDLISLLSNTQKLLHKFNSKLFWPHQIYSNDFYSAVITMINVKVIKLSTRLYMSSSEA